MAGAELLVEELGLGAFAYAGRAEEDETPGGVAFVGVRSAVSGGALEPVGAIGGGHGRTFEERRLVVARGGGVRQGWGTQGGKWKREIGNVEHRLKLMLVVALEGFYGYAGGVGTGGDQGD